MANKKVLGIDIGMNLLKMAYVADGNVLQTAKMTLPDKLINDSQIVSVEVISQVIREAMVENDLKANQVAFVVNGNRVFFQLLTVKQMSDEQLLINIPFEFQDYITTDLKEYAFDYSLISTPEEVARRAELTEEEDEYSQKGTMEILACAVPKVMLEDMNTIAMKNKLKISNITPAVSAYASLIRALEEPAQKEYCICITNSLSFLLEERQKNKSKYTITFIYFYYYFASEYFSCTSWRKWII